MNHPQYPQNSEYPEHADQSRFCPCCRGGKRRFSLFRLLFQGLFLYVALVFAGGTLQQVDHPVARETGKLLHTVTMVEPAIGWAEYQGFHRLAGGLRILERGVAIRG